jgi:hypothetical protein
MKFMVTVTKLSNGETLRVDVVVAEDNESARGNYALGNDETIAGVTEVTTPTVGVNEHIDSDAELQTLWSQQ